MDKNEFDKQIAMCNVALTILLTIGGTLASTGAAFLIAGAIEANHGIDLQGEAQNRILTTAYRFIGLGVEVFSIGLFIIAVSSIAFTIRVKRLSDSLKPDVDKSDNAQNSDRPDLLKTNSQEEIKNIDTNLEIKNLTLELINLKLELATQKLEQVTSKKSTIRHRKNTKES
ncbi:MAG: hypothetical protein EPO62_05185 [Candidatus Nitrosotenuis sp.]|nr:MAG: hypothetical protein EPO62_05185 [Candidatus Nitrosotenuis sp.]